MANRKTMQERVDALSLERQASSESDQKLAELILYISSLSESDPYCGATKLNKLLYFADAVSFADYGEPITGAQYMKEAYGPIPVRLVPVRERLQEAGDIAIQRRRFSQGEMVRIVALRDASLNELFKPRDIAVVDRIVQSLRHKDAKSLSDFTHARKPWQLARLGEIIPYSAILLSHEEITEDEVLEAQELISEHGWNGV